jgi:uncharacterized Zn finger protein (UPF0148 family)
MPPLRCPRCDLRLADTPTGHAYCMSCAAYFTVEIKEDPGPLTEAEEYRNHLEFIEDALHSSGHQRR